MPRHAMRDLIVLLPGIMGSILKKDGKPLWGFGPGAIARTLFTAGHSIATGLRLGGDDPCRETLDDGVTADALLPDLHLIPGLWKIDGYGKVADKIEAAFNVREGENFVTFPYDWRRDNRAAALRLKGQAKEWLEAWRRQSPNAKLILVAHSMGGLVSRYFLEVLGGWKDTKALITFGTPYRGSLNALDTLCNGVRKGPITLGHITDFCRSCTSIYQLLPIYPAYDATGDGTLLRVGETTGIPNVDAAKAADALKFHREIKKAVDDNMKDPNYVQARYRLFPIVGHMQDTLQSARLENEKVLLASTYENEDQSGDGTVPRVSALPPEFKDASGGTFAATKHGSLQNTTSLLEHLEGVITGLDIDLGKFLAPDRRIPLSLHVEDIYFDDEPVVVSVKAGEDRLQPVVTIINTVTGAPVCEREMRDHRDGTYSADCGKLTEGSYRIEVGGDLAVVPVADSLAVSPRVS